MARDVLQKPGLVVDGNLASSGSIPTSGSVVESLRIADTSA